MPEQPKQAEQEVLLTNQTNKSQKNNCKKITVAKAQRKCYVLPFIISSEVVFSEAFQSGAV